MSKFAIGDRVNRTTVTMKAASLLLCSQQTMAISDTRSIWKGTVRSNF